MKKMFFRRGRFVSNAFTLVELLVVISVISLLMAILLPVLNKARASATSTVCQANLRSLSHGFRIYLDDNRDVMPPAAVIPAEGNGFGVGNRLNGYILHIFVEFGAVELLFIVRICGDF
jgi:prepilin-type N-terminal cleavage/methylation domain-containing protein